MLPGINSLFRKKKGKEVSDTLEALGYFSYAGPADVPLLKKEVSNAYDAYGMLSSVYALEGGRHYPKDYRLYSLDNEALFEKEGFSRFLAEIRPTFKKLGIPVVVEEDVEEHSLSEGFTHHLSVNGVRFPVLKNFKNYSRGSALVTKKFMEIMNALLKRHDSAERVYPISKGQDGQLVFLTRKQFQFISSVYPDDENKPLSLREWARKYHAK